MNLKTSIAMVIVAGMASQAAVAQTAIRCTEMADAATGKRLMHEGQCDVRFSPMSTFKVPISLMGYDSGVLSDEHAPALPFQEGYVDWNPAWRTPTDPARWMKDSVVWYSQQVTSKLGEERFQRYVKRFDYGNQDVSGDSRRPHGLTYSWLSSSLKISPVEQVAFLRKVVNRELPLTAHAYEMTSRLMKYPTLANGWEIYAKTGSGSPILPDGAGDRARAFGWFIGWATKGQRTIVFARLAQDQKVEEGSAGLRVKETFLRDLPALLDSL